MQLALALPLSLIVIALSEMPEQLDALDLRLGRGNAHSALGMVRFGATLPTLL